MILLLLFCVVCAAIPAWLVLSNLRVFELPDRVRADFQLAGTNSHSEPSASRLEPAGGGWVVSVLLPARNEERCIRAAISSVLAQEGVDLEVLVLDDGSTDATLPIIKDFAMRDSRVRPISGSPLPPGWVGKMHACQQLADQARSPWLIFLDADVRLAPEAARQMIAFMRESKLDLASGVPRQVCRTFPERLLIPLIHFVLLGFLPLRRMRASNHPAYAAGCGQLMVVRAEAYRKAGGHAAIRQTMHDGLQLPALFRRAGLRTDLFDATGVAWCRMYYHPHEVVPGLAKNAVEGLGAPRLILPATLMLLAGQVLPFWLWPAAFFHSWLAVGLASTAVALAWLPRFLAMHRFRQPLSSALAHPLGVLTLLAIQWRALMRWLAGRPSAWKGRSYASASSGHSMEIADSRVKATSA